MVLPGLTFRIHDLELIKNRGKILDISSLLLEDIVYIDRCPEYEDSEKYSEFILKMLHEDEKIKRIHAEQVTIILGENYVFTLQQREVDIFSPVRDRIRENRSRISLNKTIIWLTHLWMLLLIITYF